MLKQTAKGAKPLPNRKVRAKDINTLARNFALLDVDQSRVIEEFFISLNTPVALSCLILFRSREYLQLALKEIDPLCYNDKYRFRDDFAAISFLRKNRFLPTGIDLKQVALASFRKSEEACKESNQRFRFPSQDPLYKGPCVYLLDACRRKITKILGNFDVDELLDMGSWGPGSTTIIKGSDTSAPRKFREERGITSRAYQLLGKILPLAYPRWFDEDKMKSLLPVEVNHVVTVPKSAKTDRTIAIEPGINSYFQLGVGRMIRRRLARVGYDLNHDDKNRQGALIGSISGHLATVDFSNASDTISKELVNYLLPATWLTVLQSVRSPCHDLEGTPTPYQKFSAMGNGFTFELESLIFLVAALTVCEYLNLSDEDVSVFGDDIIIPSKAFCLYNEFCSFLGFTVNTSKSFYSGYFRESCGDYYFDGLNVKPLFLKNRLLGIKSLFTFANGVRALAHRRGFPDSDSRFLPIWRYLIRLVPLDLRFKGSKSSGDACIHVNFDEATPIVARDGWCGYLHPALVSCSITREDDSIGILNARLSRRSVDKLYGNSIDLRQVTRMCFKRHMFTPQWYNFGRWIPCPS